VNEISFKIVTLLGASGLIALGLIAYREIFLVNALAMTLGLYVSSSIVVRGGLKRFFDVFIISCFVIVISDLCFSFLQPFIALCVSLFTMLIMIRYYLIKDHDSGWFGALCTELMGLIFLFVIEIVVVIARFFLP